ncbi:adaptor protein MecA [Anaerobacillus alkalidiazotrophicus]|uniref:Adapter protein MecA n=1 Tax=Anaerobacillus alkalidiazotrophicus TaxID=472963 RepID=A0A1S2M1B4_9BACI|nr:adaptor protein MecA [Anaerobacillus alkalidiazotrophicus]OIJ18499.1 adaptor protein MecA [Anaerobacillus alkalidiazotrophicus]OIJ19978.1 adaptor protein MecA [Anaerobacillus alkalidiazotrophicus]
MEIERLNESTIKFFITYKDIENRGFDREEIWYNRERGEELFFEMINEANDQGNFELEGPLWIQVQALDRGLEIIVTRGQITDGNVRLEIPVSNDQTNLPVDENIEDMLDENFVNNKDLQEDEEPELLDLVIGFDDFEDIISLSHHIEVRGFNNALYHFENKYYLFVMFTDEFPEDEQDDILSQILEFGYESEITIHRIQEYGKEIIADESLQELRKKFDKK